MPSLKLAFVNFFKEKRGRKVVHISKVEDFSPSHHSDFDQDKTYGIRWDHLPVEGSFSKEGLYDAKILCLGVDREDLEHEAKIMGLTIPQAAFNESLAENAPKKGKKHEKTPPKSSRGRMLKPAVTSQQQECETHAPPDPRMKKKRKATIEDSTSLKRKLKSLDNYSASSLFVADDNVLKDKSGDSEGLSYSPKVSQKDIQQPLPNNTASPKSGNQPKGLKPVKVNCGEDSSSKDISIDETNVDASLKLIENLDENKPTRSESSFFSSEIKFSVESDDSNNESDNPRPNSAERGDALKCGGAAENLEFSPSIKNSKSSRSSSLRTREAIIKKYDSSTSNSVSSTEYPASDAEKELYYNKMRRLEGELKVEKEKTKSLEANLKVQAETIKIQEEKLLKLTNEMKRVSKVNTDLSEKILSLLSSKNELNTDLGNKHQKPVKKALFSTPVKEKEKHVTGNENDPDSDSSASLAVSHTQNSKDTPSPLKKGKKSDKSTEPDTDNMKNYEMNDELFKMILLDLQNKAPLPNDGNGKVHLGNGVWITQKAWEQKIRKANVSPSIAIRDAMSKMYTAEEMSERSLEGATPVKADSSGIRKKKKKMTPHKKEAILGLFRAKTAACSGSTDKCFLDLAVSKKGKDTIKYKLKEAAKTKSP